MTLYIDATDFKKVTFAISSLGKIKKQTYKIDPHESHRTLETLEKFLKANSYKLTAISLIVVNKGPGSFTGTRVGITIANALGMALGAAVRFVGKEKFVIK